MAHWRSVNKTMLVLVCTIALVLPAGAYDNVYAHPTINELALQFFEQKIMPADPGLKQASLRGAVASGIDWSQSDGTTLLPSQGIKAVYRQKPLDDWIINGGFSADEPEAWQGLRHFYDPKNPSQPYLTDHKFFAESLAGFLAHFNVGVYGEGDYPKISAVEWAFDRSSGNVYSYPYAKMYFTKALASDDRNNEEYGKAWRSLGETMHLVADMTVPAHVRNDGHGLAYNYYEIDIDPYETSVHGGTVRRYSEYPAVNLNYNQDLSSMMREVARFTNEHFIAQDTNDRYALPALSASAAGDGYIHGTIDGTDYRIARKMSLWDDVLDIRAVPNMVREYPALDTNVIGDQKRSLIPTAIRAGAAVLDRFLPRFKVTADMTVEEEEIKGEMIPVYYLNGRIDFTGRSEEWPDKLVIRNGARLVNPATGKRMPIPAAGTVSGDNLNSFTCTFVPEVDISAQPGDTVYLEYDLGGYVIRSPDMRIPKPKETPTPTPTKTIPPAFTTPSTQAPPGHALKVFYYREGGAINYKKGNNGVMYQYYEDARGVKDGLYQSWWENGQLEFEVTYKNGKANGIYRKWAEQNGVLISECVYENDQPVTCKYWDANGNPVNY